MELDHHRGLNARRSRPASLRALGAALLLAVLALVAAPATAQQPAGAMPIPTNADGTVNVQAVCLPCRGFAQEHWLYQDALADVREELARRAAAVRERTDAALSGTLSDAQRQQAARDSRAIDILEKSIPDLERNVARTTAALQNCIREKCSAPEAPRAVQVPGGGAARAEPEPIDPKPTEDDLRGIKDLSRIFEEVEEDRRKAPTNIPQNRALCPACSALEADYKQKRARYDEASRDWSAANEISEWERYKYRMARDAHNRAQSDAVSQEAFIQRMNAKQAWRASKKETAEAYRRFELAYDAVIATGVALGVCNQRYCTGPDVKVEIVIDGGVGGGNNPFDSTNPIGGGRQPPGGAGTGGAGTAAGTLQFSSANYSGSEGGPVLMTVTRTGGSAGSATIPYLTVGGTATPGSDFVDTSGVLSWADGDASPKFFSIPLIDDTVVEPTEIFTVRLLVPAGAARKGSPDVATVSILDNDGAAQPPPAGALQFQAPSFNVSEGAGAVTINVVRVGGSAGAVSVQYLTGPDSATGGADYTPTNGTLNWAAGDAAVKSYSIPIINDTVVEGTERFFVLLNNPTGGATLGAPNPASVVIQDDDVAAPQPVGVLQFQVASVTVNEGAGVATLNVVRTGGSAGAVSVQFSTAPDSATAGADYTPVNGVLNWPAGDTSARGITVPIINDTLSESTERFFVNLSNPTGGATIAAPPTASVTIQDNDAPPEVGHLWTANTGAQYACGPTPGVGPLCNPCPQFTTLTLNNGQVTLSPIHGGGAATFSGSGTTLTSQSNTLVFSGQANHSMTITRASNLSFRTNATSTTGATCSVTCTRSAP